ncbi:MAG: DUF1800 domain-containing protein [Spirosomataceae bacterium]
MNKIILTLISWLCLLSVSHAQQVTKFGMGNYKNITVSSSSGDATGIRTLMSTGYLPNPNAASRFLSQATLGTTLSEIQNVTAIGIEQWLNNQLSLPVSFSTQAYVRKLHQYMVDSLNRNPTGKYTLANVGVNNGHFDIAWFQGSMTAPDQLRWRVTLALSEILVTSRISIFDGNPYALASYYDLIQRHAFGNYRALLDSITYHPAMGSYLTFLNNHATDIADGKQVYPDENYAREIMQLFSIGLYQLNTNGTEVKDAKGKSIPTYTNADIAGLAKVFTGLSWGDARYLGDSRKDIWSYTKRMKFFPVDSSDKYIRPWRTNPRIVNGHEPGTKTFLGYTVISRPVAQGELDIQDALNTVFNHQNVGPFLARRLIQRLVTSNPSADYIERIATIFNNNGSGVRGDLKAVIKAIFLDPEARDILTANSNAYFGMLREPFIRYMNLLKGVNLTANGGVFRNTMGRVYNNMEQRPLNSNTVFNFFIPDYSPDGDLKNAGKFAPEFQLLSAQTLAGYWNALDDWLIDNDPTDYYWGLFSGETYKPKEDPQIDLVADNVLAKNAKIPLLLDKYNHILAHGQLSAETLATIKSVIESMPYSEDGNGVPNVTESYRRIRMAIFLIMTSPDYLINR